MDLHGTFYPVPPYTVYWFSRYSVKVDNKFIRREALGKA